jgi:hypothetical protein
MTLVDQCVKLALSKHRKAWGDRTNARGQPHHLGVEVRNLTLDGLACLEQRLAAQHIQLVPQYQDFGFESRA